MGKRPLNLHGLIRTLCSLETGQLTPRGNVCPAGTVGDPLSYHFINRPKYKESDIFRCDIFKRPNVASMQWSCKCMIDDDSCECPGIFSPGQVVKVNAGTEATNPHGYLHWRYMKDVFVKEAM